MEISNEIEVKTPAIQGKINHMDEIRRLRCEKMALDIKLKSCAVTRAETQRDYEGGRLMPVEDVIFALNSMFHNISAPPQGKKCRDCYEIMEARLRGSLKLA